MSLDDPALAPAIAHAEEVAKILRENVVQGKLEGDDRYSEYPAHLFIHTLGLQKNWIWG
jgi:hypothetical protein